MSIYRAISNGQPFLWCSHTTTRDIENYIILMFPLISQRLASTNSDQCQLQSNRIGGERRALQNGSPSSKWAFSVAWPLNRHCFINERAWICIWWRSDEWMNGNYKCNWKLNTVNVNSPRNDRTPSVPRAIDNIIAKMDTWPVANT